VSHRNLASVDADAQAWELAGIKSEFLYATFIVSAKSLDISLFEVDLTV
jgi:hypothetical protein